MRKLLLTFFLHLTACGSGDPLVTASGECDGYTASTSSLYVVPWPVGTSFAVTQGNCGGTTHNGRSKYSYDFNMEIGDTVVAARAGTVYEVVEDKADNNGCQDGENHIFIEHDDGSVARYLHLTQNGSSVSVGDTVTQGQVIGISGNTGCSGGPHLHFDVTVSRDDEISIPVTFSNVGANKRGLQKGKSYLAE